MSLFKPAIGLALIVLLIVCVGVVYNFDPDTDGDGFSDKNDANPLDPGIGLVQAINLGDLSGSGQNIINSGFTIKGIDWFDQSGFSISAAGDINGDGIGDVIIGAYRAYSNSQTRAGQSYVVFGRSTLDAGEFAASLELSDIVAGGGSQGFAINGIYSEDESGRSVSAAGDINGDGIDDVIIGAHEAKPNGKSKAGESYVVFGKNTQGKGDFTVSLELSEIASSDGSQGFVLKGIDKNDWSGRSVSAAGDINGDGIGDVIVGAIGADPNGNSSAGESYVVFGKSTRDAGGFSASLELRDLALGDGSEGFVIKGIDENDYSGSSVSAAGDINGDGLDDVIIGATGADPNGKSSAGESYVVFGKNTRDDDHFSASLELSDLASGDGSQGFIINGMDTSDGSGCSVSGAGDLNGDGIDDVIIGAHGASSNGKSTSGESYVVFGKNTQKVGNFVANFELRAIVSGDGSEGFVIKGADENDDSCSSVSAAGDVNGDGIDDVIVGASRAGPNGNTAAGESYVLFGFKQTQVAP